ncbi:helix-turn-helix transcriptional regulator [Oceanospirillum beijerinckii]|uniref:helix-turn-helix transcriptional regulator n=1 Tax=Oceanospirillum beijerinckii TaxID=64976 RepID=UPI0004274391|nr:YafY family protein [Oceanospirillum beijerinckii]MAC45676.1 YafY family transcriptional regulator [Oceanospirillum sp.]
MNKAERLFQLTNLLRGRRMAITAKTLAEKLEVSERTIYRDIQALELSGIPVEGEAGIGYRIRHNFELPPLMFDRTEIIALLLGSRMVQAWSDKELAGAAGRAIDKINAILPDDLKALAEQQTLLVPDYFVQSNDADLSQQVRQAIEEKRQIQLSYNRADGQYSERVLDPLGMVYWGGKWTLIAWCHLRGDYREFRIDRMQQITLLEQYFDTGPERNLQHYIALMTAQSY